MTDGSLGATYLLPIKRSALPDAELTRYLQSVAGWCRVIIVDGSAPAVFDAARGEWSAFARHVAPSETRRCRNGKAHGVLTGLDVVDTEALIIADDDVRYDAEVLARCVAALEGADLIRPQNYFDPTPWHARWDTARTLLNRAFGGDFPGTFVVRTSALRRAGGYDGNVLFENLEMMRSIERAGGRCVSRPDLYVRRVPPTARHFWSQRVRQAYDEFARPHRLVAALAIGPTVAVLALRRRAGVIALLAAVVICLAEVGRRRYDGRRRFPLSGALLAPGWLLERALCSWLAVGRRLTGGVPYGGDKIVVAATPRWRVTGAVPLAGRADVPA
jgi:hypothetical protein